MDLKNLFKDVAALAAQAQDLGQTLLTKEAELDQVKAENAKLKGDLIATSPKNVSKEAALAVDKLIELDLLSAEKRNDAIATISSDPSRAIDYLTKTAEAVLGQRKASSLTLGHPEDSSPAEAPVEARKSPTQASDAFFDNAFNNKNNSRRK